MNSLHYQPAATLLIDYYTDPLCRQSWAFESCWYRLQTEFGHRFAWHYRLGEELPLYRLPSTTGRPRSSRLACLAVRCAERQSSHAGDLYLRALRASALRDGCDLTRPNVLLDVASELASHLPGLAKQLPPVFDAAIFRQHFLPAATSCAPAAECAAGSFPVHYMPGLMLRRAGGPDQTITLTNQSYEVLLQTLAQAAPDLFYVACLEDGGAG